jgi:hypothetical protein
MLAIHWGIMRGFMEYDLDSCLWSTSELNSLLLPHGVARARLGGSSLVTALDGERSKTRMLYVVGTDTEASLAR